MTPPNYPVSLITSVLCLFVFLFLVHRASGAEADDVCDSTSCGGIDIRFPFGLREVDPNQQSGRRCSYPKFQVRCDNQSRTLLSLPNSDELVIKSINYEYQTIQVNDPNDCLPRRFLRNLNLSDSPFMFDPTVYNPLNLTFLRCSSNFTELYPLFPVTCLGDPNNSSFSVIVMWLSSGPVPSRLSEWCDALSSAIVPISMAAVPPFWPTLTDDIQLTWTRPNCGDCEAQAQDCGFASNRGLRVACFPRLRKESSGIPRSAKYGLTIGMGIPGLLCLIGLSYFMCCKVRMHAQRHNPRPITEFPASFLLQPGPFRMGLDGPTIEKYPKTLLGESGRLPKPNDNTCPICLSEYEPKEMLRTIPECNHYFHAHCIDEWLKMNATCPLCRNSPTLTPSSTSSLSPSSSTSSSS